MVDYSKLEVNLPKRWWIRYKLSKYTARVLDRFPFIHRVVQGVHWRIGHLEMVRGQFKVDRKYVELLAQDAQDANRNDSPYGYDSEMREIGVVLEYQAQLKKKDFETCMSESPVLYREVIKTISELFEKDSEIPSMLDFGVSYAYLNSALAKRFPNKKFVGADRSPFVKLYNEWVFSDVKNLSIYAGDIFNLLQTESFKKGILFHARTALCLPPSFLKKLYGQAFKAGIKYIVGFEQCGVSRQTDSFYQFTDTPKPSVLFRNFMYTHNYPYLLKEAGYDVQEINLFKTNHPHQDFRFLRFIAKRNTAG